MPNATVTGATGAVVNVIPQASSGNTTAAQTLVSNVSSLVTSNVASFESYTASFIPAPKTTTIASVGVSSPTAMGVQNLGTLTPNVVSVLINNTDRTSFSNSQFNNNETVVAGAGGLTFTDSGSNTTVNVGGGATTITFGASAQNGTFAGDGTNTITVNSKSGVATIVGTGASVDSVFGGGSGAILFSAQSGSQAIVNAGAGNVTIVGTAGASQTVFGGTQVISDGKGGVTTVVGTTFTGSLSVTGGQGYFKGGTNGGNFMQSGAAGSTTLVGGGNGDVMSAYGANDVLVGAAAGLSTLDGSNSAGGDVFWTGINGASNMYGGKSQGDTFYLGTSTANGVGYKGSFISLHTGPNNNGTLYTLNNNVKNTINVAVFGETGVQNASVADFITGVDTLRIGANQGTLTLSSIFAGTSYAGVQIVTQQGSTIMLYNNTNFTTSNVVRT
jgi:hypothetical protein